MPLADAFRLRESGHPPAVWLVPRWWAFSRDNRYRISVFNDRSGVFSHLHPHRVCSQNAEKSVHGVVSHQQKEVPNKQRAMPRILGEQSLSLNLAPAKTYSCARGAVPETSQSLDARPSEATQAFTLIPKTIPDRQHHNQGEQSECHTRAKLTKQAGHRSYLPTHQQLRYLPIRQKKGQTQRRIPRASDLTRYAQMTDHETGCQIVKLDNPKSILKTKVPADVTLTQPAAAKHQHEQPSCSSADSGNHEDDSTCVDAMVEQQRESIQEFLAGHRDHHRHPWSKHKYPLSGSIIRKGLSMMPITAAHHLIEPDVIESRTIHFNPTVSTPTPHTRAQSSFYPSYQVCNDSYKDMSHSTQPMGKDSGCPLHKTLFTEPLPFPLKKGPLVYNHVHEYPFHVPHHPNIDHHFHRRPTNEQYECPRHVRDGLRQHDHDRHCTHDKALSPQSPSDHITHRGHINVQKTRNYHPDNQVCHHKYEHNNPHQQFDMLPGHQVAHENQYANIHHHHPQVLTNNHNHHSHHNDHEFPAIHIPNQPLHHHEAMNQIDPRGRNGCGQSKRFSYGYSQGRRTSYVRTRRGE